MLQAIRELDLLENARLWTIRGVHSTSSYFARQNDRLLSLANIRRLAWTHADAHPAQIGRELDGASLHTNPSFFELRPGTTKEAERSLKRLRRTHRRHLSIRDQLSSQRVQIDFDREQLLHAVRFLQESQDDVLPLLDNAAQLVSALPEASNLVELAGRWRDDIRNFRSRLETLRAAEGVLQGLEGRLQQRDAAFVRAAEQAVATLEDETPKPHDGEPSSTSASDQGDPSTEIDPLLERYYTRKGDTSIYHERLDELDMQHEEDLAMHQLLEDQEHVPQTALSALQAEYRSRREDILEQLSMAKDDTAALEGMCRKKGLLQADQRQTAGSPGQLAGLGGLETPAHIAHHGHGLAHNARLDPHHALEPRRAISEPLAILSLRQGLSLQSAVAPSVGDWISTLPSEGDFDSIPPRSYEGAEEARIHEPSASSRTAVNMDHEASVSPSIPSSPAWF